MQIVLLKLIFLKWGLMYKCLASLFFCLNWVLRTSLVCFWNQSKRQRAQQEVGSILACFVSKHVSVFMDSNGLGASFPGQWCCLWYFSASLLLMQSVSCRHYLSIYLSVSLPVLQHTCTDIDVVSWDCWVFESAVPCRGYFRTLLGFTAGMQYKRLWKAKRCTSNGTLADVYFVFILS